MLCDWDTTSRLATEKCALAYWYRDGAQILGDLKGEEINRDSEGYRVSDGSLCLKHDVGCLG